MTPLAGRVARWGQKVALGLALVMALPLSLAAARSPARSEEVKGEPRRALIRLGLEVGQVVAFLAPVLGLLVFWFFAFKLGVTPYISILGLGMVLLKVVEGARLRLEIEEIVRRRVHEYYAR
jgi:MFS family permease